MKSLPFFYLLFFLGSCLIKVEDTPSTDFSNAMEASPALIEEIKLPQGFKRTKVAVHSFGNWLRQLPLKTDKTVYLYNGQKKKNQAAQYAVMDISIGAKDLQQCADAVMRLRAEFLFAEKRFDEISFQDNNGKAYKWTHGANYAKFPNYLNEVFGWCGSASLEKQLKPVDKKFIEIGDVIIQGGFPGHAVIIVDNVENERGENLFLLAQSYMPAQDIHVLQNPVSTSHSPWYSLETSQLITPEWIFNPVYIKTW